MVKRGKKIPKKSSSKVKKRVKIRKETKIKRMKTREKTNSLVHKFFSNSKQKVQDNSKKIEIKKPETKPIISKKPDKPRNKRGFMGFLLFLVLILGGLASYMFRNIYVYSVSIIVVIYLILIIILKTKKSKKIEIKKPETKPVNLIKEESINATYKTEFDNFYEFIKQNKKITVSKIAIHFKMPKKQVEDWARILEEHRLIKINYPLLGDQELIYEE